MVKTIQEPKKKGEKQNMKPAAKKNTGNVAASVPAQKQAVGKNPAGKITGTPARKAKLSPKLKPEPEKGSKKSVRKSGISEKLMTRYKCKLCGYIYSPLRGEPHNGIPKGTAFEDLPEDYVCPICGMEGKGKIGKWGFEEWRPTRYICSICGYVYDEKRGEPHRNIKPGTRFEDLPDNYVCPVCALDPKIKVQFGKVFKQGFGPVE